jgi:hypothetical protein
MQSNDLGIVQLTPGLFRWEAAHPDWQPEAQPGSSADWPRMVGSVLYQAAGAATLIDPLLPGEDGTAFLSWLDGQVRDRPVSILTTTRWHRRDREELAERYRGRSNRAWNAVPEGVVPKPLRGASETVFWLPDAAALVFGDSLLGVDGGSVEVCPESWLDDVPVDRAGLAGLMGALIELPVELLLVSHGSPVLRDGRAELAHALRRARDE